MPVSLFCVIFMSKLMHHSTRKALLQYGLFVHCPHGCLTLFLPGTKFFYNPWGKWVKCYDLHKHKCLCEGSTISKYISFEKVLDEAPDEVKDKLLFHLDLFA